MFDSFSVLFMFLSVLLVYKGRYFAGGAMLSLAIFTKFFPIYIVVAIIAYIILKHQGDKAAYLKNIGYGAAGLVIMTVLLNIPMLLDGTFIESLTFALSRVGAAGTSGDGTMDIISSLGFLAVIALQPLIVGLIIYFAHRLTKSNREDAEDSFFLCLLLTTAAVFIWIPAPQYLLIIIVFLAYHIAVSDRRYLVPWVIMTVGATLFTLSMNNFSLLLSLGAYTNLIDLGWVMGMIEWMQQPVIFGTSPLLILIIVTGMIQAIGTWYILLIWFKDKMKEKVET
jgi:hypothetical protein